MCLFALANTREISATMFHYRIMNPLEFVLVKFEVVLHLSLVDEKPIRP